MQQPQAVTTLDVWIEIGNISARPSEAGVVSDFDFGIGLIAGVLPPHARIERLRVHTKNPVQFSFQGQECAQSPSDRAGYRVCHAIPIKPAALGTGAMRHFVLRGSRELSRSAIEQMKDGRSYKFTSTSVIEIDVNGSVVVKVVDFSTTYVE